MTSPAAQPTTEDAATAAIVVVLLSGNPLPTMELHLIHLLAHMGISEPAAQNAVALIVPKIEADSRTPLRPSAPKIERVPAADLPEGGFTPPALRVIPPEPHTPAQSFMRTTEVPRHSRYLVAAARRFEAAQSQQEGQVVMAKERRYLAQHLAAVHGARASAKTVDEAVARHGMTLGWHAIRDSRTTPDCVALHGKNFHAGSPPDGLYPGMRHGNTCRCSAVAPFPGAAVVGRSPAVIPFATVV